MPLSAKLQDQGMPEASEPLFFQEMDSAQTASQEKISLYQHLRLLLSAIDYAG